MVKMGVFEVQLVDAETKLPFPEVVTSDGNLRTHIPLYREYFIRVKSNMEERILVNFRINGAALGYEVKLGPKASHCGKYRNIEGESLDRALRIAPTRGSGFNTTGTIQATFYEAIYERSQNRRRSESVRRNSSGRRLERSFSLQNIAIGDHSETRPRVASKRKYSKGRVLSRVELHYSDTLEAAPRRSANATRERRARSVPR